MAVSDTLEKVNLFNIFFKRNATCIRIELNIVHILTISLKKAGAIFLNLECKSCCISAIDIAK